MNKENKHKFLPCIYCVHIIVDGRTYYCSKFDPPDVLENVTDALTYCLSAKPFTLPYQKKGEEGG